MDLDKILKALEDHLLIVIIVGSGILSGIALIFGRKDVDDL